MVHVYNPRGIQRAVRAGADVLCIGAVPKLHAPQLRIIKELHSPSDEDPRRSGEGYVRLIEWR
jgi:hypothetical protein